MKKERFREIVSNYSSTPEELKLLQKLASDYPYSQIVHLLLANAYKNQDKNRFKISLTKAALHTTDRSILKSLIEHNLVPSEAIKKQVSKSPESQSSKTTPTKDVHIEDPEALRNEVLENLQLLIQTKKEAASWLGKSATQPASSKKTSAKKTKTIKSEVKNVETKKAAIKKEPKTKVTPKVSTRAKKQTPIIDKFIKDEPRISKKSIPKNDKEDLAKDSSKMRDDVVSESLAKIFASQGKTDKAIEIYKKLIWKLPQKKALFAAQIEKLKKK